MSKYAIPIEEEMLDLIQVLNGGLRPALEEDHTWFIFDVTGPETTENPDIVLHDDFFAGKFGRVGSGYDIRKLK